MNQTNESLSHRLRNAALERTSPEAERVDDFVLDANGVVDLREVERDTLGTSIADPAKALAGIRGQLGAAHEVSDLYDDSEPERPRWRLGLRARKEYGSEIPSAVPPTRTEQIPTPVNPRLEPLSRLSSVPLAAETELHSAEDAGESRAPTSAPDGDIDLRDESQADAVRPAADCPKCMGRGRRDLFDRFSQVEYYSCDNCMHMWQRDHS